MLIIGDKPTAGPYINPFEPCERSVLKKASKRTHPKKQQRQALTRSNKLFLQSLGYNVINSRSKVQHF